MVIVFFLRFNILINFKKHLFFPSTLNFYVKPTVSLATRLETERNSLSQCQKEKKTYRSKAHFQHFLPTVSLSPNSMRFPGLRNCESQTTLMADGRSGDESLDELVSVMMTPKTGNRLHVPREVLGTQVEQSRRLVMAKHCTWWHNYKAGGDQWFFNVFLCLSLLLAGQLLSSFSLDKLREARGDHCGAQKDLRKPGPQHLCEWPKYSVGKMCICDR